MKIIAARPLCPHASRWDSLTIIINNEPTMEISHHIKWTTTFPNSRQFFFAVDQRKSVKNSCSSIHNNIDVTYKSFRWKKKTQYRFIIKSHTHTHTIIDIELVAIQPRMRSLSHFQWNTHIFFCFTCCIVILFYPFIVLFVLECDG